MPLIPVYRQCQGLTQFTSYLDTRSQSSQALKISRRYTNKPHLVLCVGRRSHGSHGRSFTRRIASSTGDSDDFASRANHRVWHVCDASRA